ncbi:MAG TPA: hypothetical protein ENN99_08350 [Chloroflexi bacterium]|nr:hypothetical protein [Chloroflexota bacterium]
MAEATIASFILRFTQEHAEGAERPAAWRGVIRHVQTHEEAHFTQLEHALAFIARYVAIAPEEQRGDLARTSSPT